MPHLALSADSAHNAARRGGESRNPVSARSRAGRGALGIALLGPGLNIVVACRMGLTTDEGAHPAYDVAGWALVRANLLAGVLPKKADYWLRVRSLKPVRHVAYAHLLFWVPPV